MLIKKLTKSGKHAELWPEPVDNKDKKSAKSKKKEKQIDPEESTDEDTEKTPQAKPESPAQNPHKIIDGGGVGSGAVKFCDSAAKTGGGGVNPLGSTGNQTPAAEKRDVESDPGVEKTGGGGGGGGGGAKKKKKKGKKSPTAGDPSSAGAPASTGSPKLPNHLIGPQSVNLSLPRQLGHQYPPHYYAPPQPVYAVSYNTSYPATRYTTSYYTSPAPDLYAYTYPGQETEPPPLDLDSYPQQSSDSFELFSDENPNGCSIM
ncbi:heavy metal transport/detoxification superfamily protein [Actinidia rufa]|uniref:Heavy metal transport/detoxification superfamily protein n=1 Tax=Actinidia rufa TaxID=165716 RepID=A0A7J0F9I6_9ERIC|nr:heavy metal transport/detoxification superfamily protein [Actinidia rufa]